MKSRIVLSINPSYHCNFRCSFCYLSEQQLSDRGRIALDSMVHRLNEISSVFEIEWIDLYGGEITLLPAEYLSDLLRTLRVFYSGKVNLITNFSTQSKLYHQEDVELTISWDYLAREQHERIYEKMLRLQKPFHILTLVSDPILKLTDEELDHFIERLNQLPALSTVELKPFSDNHHHRQNLRHSDFESHVIRWLERRHRFKFEFINQKNIEKALSRSYSAWSDNHLYLTPNGKFAVLDFDDQGRESFIELESIEDYRSWADREKQKVWASPICSNCTYVGHCLSEHLQNVQDLTHSCNGFRGLLDWSKSNLRDSVLV